MAVGAPACAAPEGKARPAVKRPAAARAADAPDLAAYGRRDDVMRFAADIAARNGLYLDWVEALLERSRYVPTVARLVMPSATATSRNWHAYRARLVEPRRIRAGLAFRDEHGRWLARAEAMYGVPAELVLGILGVETIYGRNTGSFRVLDALATLAFDFPAGRSDRSGFFREELEQFIVLCYRDGLDATSIAGSYAGAIGLPQFMPSSIARHAVDFDGDGRIDLHASAADAIGSIASFLVNHGWQRGMPTHYEVAPPEDPADLAALLAPDIVPTFTAQQMIDRGAVLPAAALRHPGKLALVQLHNGDEPPTFVAGTDNFYAVTRYNRSSYYAMAVIELGAALRGR